METTSSVSLYCARLEDSRYSLSHVSLEPSILPGTEQVGVLSILNKKQLQALLNWVVTSLSLCAITSVFFFSPKQPQTGLHQLQYLSL